MPKRKRPTAAKTRNPFWRLRRALKERRRESAKTYRRAAARRAARRAVRADD